MKIGIIGGGQLARMLALAGIPLGIDFTFLVTHTQNCVSPLGTVKQTLDYNEKDCLDFAECVDVITYENENIPPAVIATLAAHKPVRPGINALKTSQQRQHERQLFQAHALPHPKTEALINFNTAEELLQHFAYPFLLKRNAGGFDGRGQTFFDNNNPMTETIFQHERTLSLAQTLIEFDHEISCISVHGAHQPTAVYPICQNTHRDGILASTVPLQSHPLTDKAIAINQCIADALDYQGVLTVEYFVVGDALLINETAPRVHNSGHWTIDASQTSQFENHCRAILDLPLGDTAMTQPALMLNIIGAWPHTSTLLAHPGLHCHDYKKTARSQRKIGHVTLTGEHNIDAFLAKNKTPDFIV